MEAPTYGTGGSDAESVAVADVNGDGKPDLVVANGDSVGVLLGNGDGTFQPAVSYGSSGGTDVAVADLNGDGKPDLLLANGGSVGVLLGNGDGTFQAAVNYSSGGSGTESVVAVADVNGDGKPDLVLATGRGSAFQPCGTDGTVAVLLGNGDGTFRPPVNYAWGGEDDMSLAVADVNGDGKPDLLVAGISFACAEFGSVGVLLGNGDGTFQEAVNYDTDYVTDSVAVADLNGDGKPDLVVANFCDSSIRCWNTYFGPSSVGVLLGNGDGTFQAVVEYSSGGYFADSVAVADVNGDDKPDLLVADGSGVSVLLGNGDGTFQSAASYYVGGYEADSVAVADVNGDGKPDLLVANGCSIGIPCANPGAIGVLLGKGDGTFQSAASYYASGYGEDSVAVVDLNGDGRPDLVVANYTAGGLYSNGDVAVLLGNADGTFQAAVSHGWSGYDFSSAESVAVADVNGDGKPDLLVAIECINNSGCDGPNPSVGVLLGNGDGTFQAAVTYGSGGSDATSVAVADVDGDGKPDLAVATGSGVGVLLGNGDGTFQAAVTYGSGGSDATSVAVADVNGDGKPDLVVANGCVSSSNCANGNVGVLLGNGDGTFQSAVIYGSGGSDATSVAVADVNGDGRPDLVVGNECVSSGNCANGSVGVLLGNGNGTFQVAVALMTPPGPGPLDGFAMISPGPGALVVADFNGDGKLDIASGHANTLLLGNGDGTFQSGLTLGAPGWGAIAVGDFNRDGKPDLAVGGGSGVTALLNISPSSAPTTITSSSNPSELGQSVTFTATVTHTGSGTPTGTVTFSDGSTLLGTSPLNGGTATLTNGTLTVGLHSISAVYSGDTNFRSSSASLNQTVNQAGTTTTVFSSLNPSALGQAVTFTATITPQYSGPVSGTVTFKDGSTTLGSGAVSGNVANLTKSGLAIGTHSVTAVYSGDSNFTGSTSNTLSQVVANATTTTTLLSSINPSVQGKSVTFASAVSSSDGGMPTGKVQFVNGSTILATVTLTSGAAKYSTSKLSLGYNSITVVYKGDATNAGSTSAPLVQFVLAATTTTLTSSPNPSAYGQTVLYAAVVTSSMGAPPDGEVITFTQGTVVLGTGTLSGGTATLSFSALAVGTKAVKAAYSGDLNFASSTSTIDNQVIVKAATTTALSSSQNPSSFNQPVTFATTVSPQFNGTTPTGSVTFYNGTAALGTVTLINGSASYTTTKLAVGTHSISAVYKGSSSFNTSTSAALNQVVNQASTTTTLVSSLNPSNFGQSVTLTANVAARFGGTAAGSITFMDGTTTLKTMNLSGGAANYTTTKLATGTHNITATYSGSTSFSGSSASLTQAVN